jgi:hypothetical protein
MARVADIDDGNTVLVVRAGVVHGRAEGGARPGDVGAVLRPRHVGVGRPVADALVRLRVRVVHIFFGEAEGRVTDQGEAAVVTVFGAAAGLIRDRDVTLQASFRQVVPSAVGRRRASGTSVDEQACRQHGDHRRDDADAALP